MSYSIYHGVYREPIAGFNMKALLLITGGLIGLVVGLHYVVAQIDASVAGVMPDYGDSTLELAPPVLDATITGYRYQGLFNGEHNALQPAQGYRLYQAATPVQYTVEE